MSKSPNESSAGNGDNDLAHSSDPPNPLIPLPVVVSPLNSTPFRNDTITDATLDAKLIEHRNQMSKTMKDSIHDTRKSLEKLITSLPDSALTLRSTLTLQLNTLAQQLAGVDQTLQNVTVSTATTTAVVVHLQDTIQTVIVAPITDIKDNLNRLATNLHELHSKVDWTDIATFE